LPGATGGWGDGREVFIVPVITVMSSEGETS
jgi:hypothetical protein